MNQRGWSLIESLAAIVVIGIAVALFTKVQHMTNRDSGTNSKILLAGKMIEKHLEDTRIYIGKDTINNWPPRSNTLSPTAPEFITLVSQVGPAFSPKDGAPVNNVVRMDILTYWTSPYTDSLKVTTYVAKRF
jgi:prepilin-type N-terminal cleavage/methylation domain-containing protein